MSNLKYCCCVASVLMGILSGCRKEPAVIPEGKLVPLLADLYVAEAYSMRPTGEFGYARDSIGSAILEANGFTIQQLDSTLGWYGKNIDTYSELYEKVDRELEKRSRELARAHGKTETDEDGNIWPYAPQYRLTSRDLADGIAFNISMPEAQNGLEVEWKIRNAEAVNLDMLLGVEYSDGESVFQTANLYGNQRTGITFETDSTRSVRRIFGTLHPQAEKILRPILIDSISLRLLPPGQPVPYARPRRNRYRMYNRVVLPEPLNDSIENANVTIQKTQ